MGRTIKRAGSAIGESTPLLLPRLPLPLHSPARQPFLPGVLPLVVQSGSQTAAALTA